MAKHLAAGPAAAQRPVLWRITAAAGVRARSAASGTASIVGTLAPNDVVDVSEEAIVGMWIRECITTLAKGPEGGSDADKIKWLRCSAGWFQLTVCREYTMCD